MPSSSKCTLHFRWSFIFSTYGLYFLPGSNFAPFEEMKVPVSNSAVFVFPKKCPLEDFGGFRVVRTNVVHICRIYIQAYAQIHRFWCVNTNSFTNNILVTFSILSINVYAIAQCQRVPVASLSLWTRPCLSGGISWSSVTTRSSERPPVMSSFDVSSIRRPSWNAAWFTRRATWMMRALVCHGVIRRSFILECSYMDLFVNKWAWLWFWGLQSSGPAMSHVCMSLTCVHHVCSCHPMLHIPVSVWDVFWNGFHHFG